MGASSSAYLIMLLNLDLAVIRNFIKMHVDPYLHDLYTSLLKELKVQLQRRVSI
jgi:hypothetical protein